MKKTILLLILCFTVMAGLASCSEKEQEASSPPEENKKIEYYTCPMHPQIRSAKPGQCPICGMNLEPHYVGSDGHPHPESGPQGLEDSKSDSPLVFRISEEKIQKIGVKLAPVQIKSLLREIHAPGRVAYHPELFAAQKEYLILLKGSYNGGKDLVQAVKQRLQILGMSEEQIRALSRQQGPQTSLLFPPQKGNVWIYGSIYESDLAWVKTGTPVQVLISESSEPYNTSIESIDPALDPMTRTAQVRLQVPARDGLRPGRLIQLSIQAQSPETLTLPNEALIDTGARQIAYVAQGDGRFEKRSIRIGKRGSEESEVLKGLREGEQVVVQANFLIDSEARLQMP